MEKSYIDWSHGRVSVNTTEIELHERLHHERAQTRKTRQQVFSNPRLKLIPKIESRLGNPIRGRVLDLGCGDGYFSAWLSSNRKIEEVYALEVTESAVSELIPNTMAAIGEGAEHVRPVLGSFDAIPLDGYFDYVVALGALHHTSDLFTTLSSVYSALKPGGFLIAQEPMTNDLTGNRFFTDEYNRVENFQGLRTIRLGERNDRFFRECEYKVALHYAGFEIEIFETVENITSRPVISKLNRYLRWLVATVKGRQKGIRKAVPMLLVAKKPLHPSSQVPHVWKRLLE